MNKFFQLLSSVILLFGCGAEKAFTVQVQNAGAVADTLVVRESATEKVLATLPLDGARQEQSFYIDAPVTASVNFKNGNSKNGYLVVLQPGRKMNISIDKASVITTDHKADSLLNYLWKSNLEFINENWEVISDSDSLQMQVRALFEGFEQERATIIQNNKDLLTAEEAEILLFQNRARIHAFLFYYGRNMKKLSHNSSFFGFINSISNNSDLAKMLPHNILYKYEVQYLNEYDSLTSINSFLDFIEKQTNNGELEEILKAVYVSEIIQHPSYWKKHEKLFNSKDLQQVLLREKTNKYYGLIGRSSNSFFSSQKGKKGYDFTATSISGEMVKLSDYKGKLVFIDTWASWCSPCLEQRPAVLKLAEKYRNNPAIEFLMISVDSSKEKWEMALAKKGASVDGQELIIENGMGTEFGDQYLVKSIPRYILIDRNGLIINANLSEPSLAVEELIEQALISR